MANETAGVFCVAGATCVRISCYTAHNMSYDLYFWRQEPECSLSPAEIVGRLEESNTPDIPGLAHLDTARLIVRLREVLPEIYENQTTDPDFPLQLIWEDKDDNAFLVHWSEIHVSIESHGVDGEILNKIIDVALEFGCRLYDPQTDVRYDGG